MLNMENKRDLPTPMLHEVKINCKCGHIFTDHAYIIGDWKTCPECKHINIHKFCKNCHPFYHEGWKNNVKDF